MQARQADAPPLSNPWLVVSLLSMLYCISALDRQLIAVLAEPLRKDLGLTDVELGLLSGPVFATFYAGFGIPLALLADRIGRVPVLAGACMIWSIACACCGISNAFTQLAASRALVGVGEAGGNAPAYALIADYFPPHQRGTANAIFGVGAPIGIALAVSAGGVIAINYGWRFSFIVPGIIGLIVAIALLVLIREPRRAEPTAGAPCATFLSVVQCYFRHPALPFMGIGAGFGSFVGYGTTSWMPALLMRSKGMDMGELSTYYGPLSGISMGIGILVGGVLADRLARRSVRSYALVPAVAFALAIPAILGVVFAEGWPLALALAFFPLLLNATFLAPVLTYVQGEMSPHRRSTASSITLLFATLLGAGAGPMVVGALSEVLGGAADPRALERAMLCMVPAMLITMTMFAIAALRMRKAGETIAAT